MPISAEFWIAPPGVASAKMMSSGFVGLRSNAERIVVDHADDVRSALDRKDLDGDRIVSELAITPQGPFNWKQPDPAWVAVVLDAFDGGLCLNRESEFEPHGRTSDYGRVPRGAILHAHDRPIGHVYDVAGELVISQALRTLLGDAVTCHGSIEQDGGVVEGYVRFEPRVIRPFVDPLSYQRSRPCRDCGATWAPLRGTWFSLEQQPLADDAIWSTPGFGHFQAEYPLVISLTLAKRIHQAFRGKGYTMEPVFGGHSSEYRRAEEMVAVFESMKTARSSEARPG
jgi:hypothetical protein